MGKKRVFVGGRDVPVQLPDPLAPDFTVRLQNTVREPLVGATLTDLVTKVVFAPYDGPILKTIGQVTKHLGNGNASCAQVDDVRKLVTDRALVTRSAPRTPRRSPMR